MTLDDKKIPPQPLRDYQIELIAQIEVAIAQGHRRIMLQLPTGAGKTRCFVELVKNHRFAPYAGGVHNCLIIAHRKELIDQAVKALKRELKNTPTIGIGIIKAGEKPYPNRSIQVASILTLIRRSFPPAGFVIIDEAHHAPAETYQKVIENYSNAIILGVTATPIRRDGKGFQDVFDILIKGPSISELTAKQYLCPYRLFAYYDQRISLHNISTKAGDFDLHQLADAVAASEVRADLVKTWEQHAKGKRTVVFAVNKKLSQEYVEAYFKAGYIAEHIDNKTPKAERDDILERFKQGKTQILCNCNIVTEGFDLPEMDCVQVVRPTKSLSLWLQMVGRSLRIADAKTETIILDHTDNYERLRLPDAERNWTLDGIDRKLRGLLESQENMIRNRFRKLPPHLEGELLEVYSNLTTLKPTREILVIPKPTPKPTPKKTIIDKDTGSNFIENVGGVIKPQMVAIPGGKFQMGDNDLKYAKPSHSVSIKPFFISKYLVTQEQYQAIMGTNPSHFKGAKLPVNNVSWHDAMEFCQKLSQKTGSTYRLPSEAEWEYACRAGTQTKYYFGDDEKQLGNYAWYNANANNEIHPVGEKYPNQFGLYDMHGNVWEWCSDGWHENYKNAPADGNSWNSSTDNSRVLRGGSWFILAGLCCAGYRNRNNADKRYNHYGFRVACSTFRPKTLYR